MITTVVVDLFPNNDHEYCKGGIIKPHDYPFGGTKYTILAEISIKKAIGIRLIEQIFDSKLHPRSGLDKARDFPGTAYLCQGINILDFLNCNGKM